MKLNPSVAALLLASAPFVLSSSSIPIVAAVPNHAAAVVQYFPGTGASAGYDQPSAVLGEPSRLTPGEYGGPVDPFSSPWQPGQLVSVGTGGSLTVRFADPVWNLAGNPRGLDFLVFASAAFLIVNGDYTGGGITDGSLLGATEGLSRVSVSADGVSFFTLDPALAPGPDGLFPTDGSGDFTLAVDPTLGESDFDGLDLEGIRALYAGSGGGIGYDIAWARNGIGEAVHLDRIEFVRLEVLSDRVEIDGFSAVPEPSTTLLLLAGLSLWLFLAPRRRPAAR